MLRKAIVAGLLVTASAAPASAQSDNAATASPETALAIEIVELTFQPRRARTDALAAFERNFMASFEGNEQGRALLAAKPAAVAAMREAGVSELARMLDVELLPAMSQRLAADYVASFSAKELQQLRDFWSSAPGRRLIANLQEAGLRNGGAPTPVVVPEDDRQAVSAFQATTAARREAELTARMGPGLMQWFGESLAKLMPRVQAKIGEAAQRLASPTGTQ